MLSRFVEDVRVLEPSAGVQDIAILPDGRTMLVYRLTTDGVDLSAAGPRTHAKFKSPVGLVRAVMMQFKPGWSAALLGVAASELTDRVVWLDELWGRAAADLRDDLAAARTVTEVIDRLGEALAARSGQDDESASARLARRAARLLEAGDVRIDSVAEQLGVTARHLRRVFTEGIGIGPKEFARTMRLQRALRMSATSTDWGRIATAAGYYDQAHLIGDFRDLVGLTPGAFAKRASVR